MILRAVTVFIVIFSVVSFAIGTYQRGMLFFGDTDLTYHFGENFFSFKNVYLWNDYFKAGIFDFDKFQAFYLKKAVFVINGVTDLYFFSYLWYFLPIFFYILSFYYLIQEVQRLFFQEVKFLRFNAILISIFAGINGIFVLYYGQTLVVLSLLLVNVFLLFYIRNIRYLKSEQRNNYTYIIVGGLALSQINVYLHTAFLLFYAALLLAIINYRFIFQYWRAFAVQIGILIVLTMLLNAQWIIPVFSQAFFEDVSVKNLVIYDPQLGWEQAKSISKNIFMSDLLKMKSYHVFENHPGYFNLFYFLPMGIILFFLTKRRATLDRNFQRMLIFLGISIFFSFGIRPVSEFFYQILWERLPFFTAFRTIFKFAFLYLYALTFMLAYILAITKKGREYYIIVWLLLFNIMFSMHYYWQPEVARTLQQYTIPEYYFSLQAANLSSLNDKLGNNISSPQFNWQFQYDWSPEKVDGMNVLPYFYGPGFLINGAQDSPDVQYIYNDYFDYNLRNNKLDTLKNLLSIRNIKFITYQDDLRVTNNESTPYIVKSNFETKPLYEKVFSKKFVSEICSRVSVFDKLSVCQVKNSLFTPLFQVKDSQPIEIKNQKYITDLKGASYFIPYNKRSEKGHQQVNLIEENPIIVNDLMQIGITDVNDVRIFETKIRDSVDKFSTKKTVYLSFRSFEVKNCYYQISCDLFFFQGVQPGRYRMYYVRHLVPDEHVESKEYSITISDHVPDEFIENTVHKLHAGDKIQDYVASDHSQQLSFLSKRINDIGEVEIQGSNALIRTLSDSFFSSGTFYLVQEIEGLSENQSDEKIEFKKINPTKFRVRIHSARNPFSLAFSENFDKNWQIYTSPLSPLRVNLSDLDGYTLLRGNDKDQATKEELEDFIRNGMITDLGDLKEKTRKHEIRKDNETLLENIEKYRIGFISKNIRGVIQNDNLPQGNPWETWFQEPYLANNSHFEDDGYSNGWLIDPEGVCGENAGCIRNSDGTVDFELVIEFWPQRMFYIGLGLSVVTFLFCVMFLSLLSWRKFSSKSIV